MIVVLEFMITTIWAQSFDLFNQKNLEKVLATFHTKLDPSVIRPSEEVRVVITSEVEEGWHIFSVVPSDDEYAPPPTQVSWKINPFITRSPIYEMNPVIEYVPPLELTLSYHEGTSRLYQNFQVPEDMPAGSYQLQGSLQYQVCSDKICFPSKKVKLSIPFKVEAGEIRPAYAYMNRIIDEIPSEGLFSSMPTSLDDIFAGGIWAFLLLAASMGALAWLTPCVFPMIPITVSFFSKRAQESHQYILKLAIAFMLGIIISYTCTGLILAGFMGAAGAAQLAVNPWINLLITLLLVIFALNLLGVFELRIPTGWIQLADQISPRLGGLAGISLMGMIFTLTAFTCTVPFVGTLLIGAAQGQWTWPILGMLVFSTVFAFPFFLLALFPRLIQSFRSKSGNWMVQLKLILGLVELMAAFKFLSNADLVLGWGVINRTIVLWAWTFLALCMALIILDVLWRRIIITQKQLFSRVMFALPFLILSAYLGQGATGKLLDGWLESYLPPDLGPQQSMIGKSVNDELQPIDKVHNLPWKSNLETALIVAQEQQKPIFTDFTGYTCINCRWMEKNVFAETSVYEVLRDKFILVQLYTDGGEGYESNQKLQVERFKTVALPFYVILSPENAVLGKRAGISSPQEFLQFLSRTRKNI